MSTPAEKMVEEPVQETQETQSVTQAPSWPENWRQMYAGEDEKKLSKLSRYTSPNAALDALFAAQHRISSGELKSPFPETGSDEEKARWRVENGLPESPDKYDLSFDDGLVIGDDDMKQIQDFLGVAYEQNLSPNQVKGAVRWYYDQLQKQEEELTTYDQQAVQEAENNLRTEWGGDYQGNMNRIQALFDQAPAEVKNNLMNARLDDGTLLRANPDAMKYFADLAVQLNPVTTLIPGAGANISGAIEDEIAKIEKVMRTNRTEYNKDERLQKRLLELYNARLKVQR